MDVKIPDVGYSKINGGKMKIKKLAKGNKELHYFVPLFWRLDKLVRIDFHEVLRRGTFFRTRIETIVMGTDKLAQIKKRKISANELFFDKVLMGKEVEFIAGESIKFRGTAIAVVKLQGYNYLEIEIIPAELYCYAWINNENRCCYLSVLS